MDNLLQALATFEYEPSYRNTAADTDTDQGLDERQIEQMQREAEQRALYAAINLLAKAAARADGFINGLSSDEIDISIDPETGACSMSLKRTLDEQRVETDLGEAEKEYMVYQRKADDVSGNPQYGFDYVRGVASTEP